MSRCVKRDNAVPSSGHSNHIACLITGRTFVGTGTLLYWTLTLLVPGCGYYIMYTFLPNFSTAYAGHNGTGTEDSHALSAQRYESGPSFLASSRVASYGISL